ncbi:glycine cleavage T C-terminal barrel domain-containing protein, partial [Bacillus halotolerans]|uniref:glycine cleavage T C-terminal barrel domain-containing protein n=1 Tax=Bacillus halotolerans TaxID=260554 RepID=UPI000575E421
RHGYEVLQSGKSVGKVTTGTQSPTLGKNVGLALVDAGASEIGTVVEVEIRKKLVKAKVVKTPFYKR